MKESVSHKTPKIMYGSLYVVIVCLDFLFAEKACNSVCSMARIQSSCPSSKSPIVICILSLNGGLQKTVSSIGVWYVFNFVDLRDRD